MFDKLLILDTGGYLIYSGNPVDSIVYFKSRTHQANWNESECSVCGNVNPEQVFNILEARVLDEYGNLTSHRKNKPQEWEKYYKEYIVEADETVKKEASQSRRIPPILFKVPSLFKQFTIFTLRDTLAKLSDKQYLVINFFEAPVLAFFLSYLIKYYNVDAEQTQGYVFSDNSNLPVYIFMSVIVAIFIGLTVSAEEIIKDRLILKREQFLNLSWNSYLMSKVIILLVLSAIQALLFVLVGNTVLEIKGMYWQYWMVLFSSWIVSILFGLNISNSFKTAITVYILIPFLVIPNIILSGVMVKFEKLNPDIVSPGKIPFYGEIIPARWSYEALATYQYTENDYEKLFYKYDKISNTANYKKDYWLTHLENKLTLVAKYYNQEDKRADVDQYLRLIKNELLTENKFFAKKKRGDRFIFKDVDAIQYENINKKFIIKLKKHFLLLRDYYVILFNKSDGKKDQLKTKLQATEKDKEEFINFKRHYFNQTLSDFVRNKNALNAIIEYKDHLYRKVDPIYQEPETNFVRAHFYSPTKRLFGLSLSTFWINLIVLWSLAIFLYLTLYFSLFKKVMDGFGKLTDRFFKEE